MTRSTLIAFFFAALLCPSAGLAATVSLTATLAGSLETPPVNTPAQGSGDFSYDTATGQLNYFINYGGLSGAATAADIHGPAGPKAIGPVAIHFISPESPISGTKTLTEVQAAALLNGQMYVEIDSRDHPTGELRGQIHK